MNITITATLTEEQIEILSNAKGYQPTVSTWPIEELTTIPNPKTRADFIAEQYLGLITSDASKEFSAYSNRQREEARIAEENAIREQVVASISSSIWN